MCLSCQFHEREEGGCKACVHVTDQEIDLRQLCRTTLLPELWDIFQTILFISPSSENGLNLSGAQAYLYDAELPQVTHQEFWNIMCYFLRRSNEKFFAKMKLRRENGK